MRALLLATILQAGLLCSTGTLSAQILASREIAAKDEEAQRASPDWSASRKVEQRIEAGDKQALNDLAGMDPVVAVPFLAYYAKDRSTDPEAATIAQETLKRVRGIRDYFRKLIAELHVQIGGDFDTERQFKTLALIGTKDAAAAAASFLFDESEFKNPEPNSDVSGTSLRYQAVDALMKMKLADAPTNKPFYAANDEDIQKWRAWWLAHKAEYEK